MIDTLIIITMVNMTGIIMIVILSIDFCLSYRMLNIVMMRLINFEK